MELREKLLKMIAVEIARAQADADLLAIKRINENDSKLVEFLKALAA